MSSDSGESSPSVEPRPREHSPYHRSRFNVPPLLLFALREQLRRPGETALLFAALAAVVTALSIPLLFFHALSATAERVLASSPSLVIRRVDPGGFAPIPAQEALDAVRAVRGVVESRSRIWGVVASADSAVSMLGIDAETCRALSDHDAICPEAGQTVVGRSLALRSGESLRLRGPGAERAFTVRDVFSEQHDAVTHDLVLIDRDEAKELLGLAPHLASDIAVWVFHEAEEEAIRGDLERALPWSVRITGRGEATEALLAALGGRSGLDVASMIPAIMALALLMITLGRQGRNGRLEVALLKAMGWTTADVVRLRLIQILAVACPAVAGGLAAAFSVVIWPGVPEVLNIVLKWSGPAPRLDLDASGAIVVMAVVAGVALVPVVAAALWPAIRTAVSDPDELLEEM